MAMAADHLHSGRRRVSSSFWRLTLFFCILDLSKCLWVWVWAGLSETPPHPAPSAPVDMCLCLQPPLSLWEPRHCSCVLRVLGCRKSFPPSFRSIMLWSSSSLWPISVWPRSWTQVSSLGLRKMRIKRMISVRRSIRRWRWGVFRCGWSGAPPAAFTDRRAVHTALCVTTV